MIKNGAVGLLLCALLAGCRRGDHEGFPHQGVIEYEERDLAFEVSGRLAEVAVREGDTVGPGALIARLDDSLARSALSARESEARAAGDQLALLRAGARGEDVRAMRARLEAARASEALLERSAARARTMAQAGAATPAALDEAEAQYARAQGDRRALEQNLAALSSGARKQEIQAAEHRLAAAEAAATLERERLLRHELRARNAGEVLEVHLESSEMAPAGVPVVTIAEVERPYAEVFVPQGRLAGIRAGTPAQAQVDGVPDELVGRVELVYRRTEFTPRYLFSASERGNLVVRVKVRFEDPRRLLHAGVPAFVRFLEGARPRGDAGP
jgi:HlyD family secretion protein